MCAQFIALILMLQQFTNKNQRSTNREINFGCHFLFYEHSDLDRIDNQFNVNLFSYILEAIRLIYNQYMKRKQKVLKKALKEQISPQKILNALSLDEVIDQFLNQRDHDIGLQNVDSQLLEIVLAKLMQRKQSEDQNEDSIIKIDVLTLGEPQLLAFCREKGLVSLHQYLDGIRHKTYRSHSDYGYMLVNAFPNQFLIGPRCTHYHCRTTAHRIESQYGIFNKNNTQDEKEGDQLNHQSDSNFINDNESEQSQQIAMKRKKKSQKKRVSNQQKLTSSNKKRSNMKNMLNSDEESEQSHHKNKKARNKKQNKMQILQEQEQDKEENQLLYQILQTLQADEILQTLEYNAIFEYLSQKCIEKLSPIVDQISEAVLINNKKSKRETNHAHKQKNHNKRLTKSKLNLKELSLYELLIECSKHNIVSSEDLARWESFQLEAHPQLAFKLIEINPENYVIKGQFRGQEEQNINLFIESIYQKYQQKKSRRLQEDELQVDPNNEDDSEQIEDQQSDDEGLQQQSNYSIDSEEQNLGEI